MRYTVQDEDDFRVDVAAFIIVAVIGAVFALVAWSTGALAATTYEQALQDELAASDLVGSDPNISDAVEVDYWRCYASAFVKTQIGSADLEQLDKLVAQGITNDPLVAKWRKRLDAALADVSSRPNRETEGRMSTLCPDTLHKIGG